MKVFIIMGETITNPHDPVWKRNLSSPGLITATPGLDQEISKIGPARQSEVDQ